MRLYVFVYVRVCLHALVLFDVRVGRAGVERGAAMTGKEVVGSVRGVWERLVSVTHMLLSCVCVCVCARAPGAVEGAVRDCGCEEGR